MIHFDFDEEKLAAIVEKAVNNAFAAKTNLNVEHVRERTTLHSIRELSEFIGCSTVTAQKFKNEGRIPYRQVGRKVLFDSFEVLKAMEQCKKKNRK
jgi:hypothetical protein